VDLYSELWIGCIKLLVVSLQQLVRIHAKGCVIVLKCIWNNHNPMVGCMTSN